MHILLADDNKATALPVILFLQQQGYRLTYVQDGAAAVEAYRNDPPDIVLMDVEMPIMDGIEATRQIKALGAARWVPVLLLTANSTQQQVVAGLDAGADEYLLKPVVFNILDARLRSMRRIADMQDRLFSVLDNVYEGILSIDENGIVQSYNLAAERIFGYPPAEVIGCNVKMLMPSPYTEEHDGYLARYLRERTPHVIGSGRKVRGRRKNGETFPMRLAVSEVRRNGLSQFIGLVSDISAEEAAREREVLAAQAIAKSERFLKTITDALPGMVAYWDKDLRSRFANKPYLEWFGKPPEAIIGCHMREVLGEQLFALNEPYARAVLAGERQNFERCITKADGSVGYTWANYIPDIDTQGDVAGFFVLVSDVTPLKQAENELKLAASVFHNTLEGIIVTDGKGVMLSVNPAFSEITGFSNAEAVGQSTRIFKSNRHDAAFYRAMWQDILDNGRWQGEIWNRRKNGELFLIRMTITMIRGMADDTVRYLSVFSDITDIWQQDERMRHLAFHDALTDLPNRSLLTERLEHQIAMAEREQRGMALMFLDLDRFKFVNDSLGHDIGDDLLKAVANRLLGLVRHSDTVARLGGDEFVILLDNPANKAEVADIASRIVAEINRPMEFRGKQAQVGTSIGIAMYPSDGASPEALMKSADSAMYAAKNAGKNTYRFSALSMTTTDD